MDAYEKFPAIKGLSALHERLIEGFRAGRILHAYLLCGDAVSARDFARLLACAMVCESGAGPCGHCPPCRRILTGSHPDMYTIAEEGNIKVEAIRALREWMKNRAWEDGHRMIFLRDAHNMTPQAQNALLKSLEEPVGDTVFFLMTDAPQVLLPTITSRCMQVNMPPVHNVDRDEKLRAFRDALIDSFVKVQRYGDIASALGPEIMEWKDKNGALNTALELFSARIKDENLPAAFREAFTLRAASYMIIAIEDLQNQARSNVSMNALWDLLFMSVVEGEQYGQSNRYTL